MAYSGDVTVGGEDRGMRDEEGMTLYNELYKKVKDDRWTDNGAFRNV
jgi:hypothetical protein